MEKLSVAFEQTPPGAWRDSVPDYHTPGRFRDANLKSGYLYQMYSYIRSQEGPDPKWDTAAGLFLHPAVGEDIYQEALIQNHTITFATVDLAKPSVAVRSQLREILGGIEQRRQTVSSIGGAVS